MLAMGLSAEQVAKATQLPLDHVLENVVAPRPRMARLI